MAIFEDDKWKEVREIYVLLKEGKGWARVTKSNIDDLQLAALADENKELERELKNWR